MELIIENNAFQNLGKCLDSNCKDDYQVDDFLQLCIQIIFYDSINISGLVPQFVKNESNDILNRLENKYGINNIKFQEINEEQTSKLVNSSANILENYIDIYLSDYTKFISSGEYKYDDLPELDTDSYEQIKAATLAIKKGKLDVFLEKSLKQLNRQNDSTIVQILNNANISSKIISFSNNHDWNEHSTGQLISYIRQTINKEMSIFFGSIYAPSVKRAKKEKQIHQIYYLKVSDFIQKIAPKLFISEFPNVPSIEDYLIEKGKGIPNDILTIVTELRGIFSPMRSYLDIVGNKTLMGSLIALNEIGERLSEEIVYGKNRMLEHICKDECEEKIISDNSNSNRMELIKACIISFTKVMEDMIPYHNAIYFRNRLFGNCKNNV